jgi:hypothetical protein
MTYDELMGSILTAQEQMFQHSIEANSVTLNGRKYGKLIESLPPNIKPTIFGMAVKADYAMPDDYDFLVQYEPPKPKTNADRIRSMSDEELATYLDNMQGLAYINGFDSEPIRLYPNNYGAWIEWLRQEVTDG